MFGERFSEKPGKSPYWTDIMIAEAGINHKAIVGDGCTSPPKAFCSDQSRHSAASASRAAHHSARTSEFSGDHQACGARAGDDDVFCVQSGHTGALPTGRFGIRVLDAVPQ